MNRQHRCIVVLVTIILAVVCMGANNHSDVAQEFPEEVARLRVQLSRTAAIRCQACEFPAEMNFLFDQQESQGGLLSRCTGCSRVFHNRCFVDNRCPETTCNTAREPVEGVEAMNCEWENRQELYERCAQGQVVPRGFRENARHWAQVFFDEDEATRAIFEALKNRWVQRLRNPDDQQVSLNQIITEIPDLSGEICLVCRENMTAEAVVDNEVEIVQHSRCNHEMHRACMQGWLPHRPRYYTMLNGQLFLVSEQCLNRCRLLGEWQRSPVRSLGGSLRHDLRPGYLTEDRVLRCAARTDLYRRACLLLAAQHRQAMEVEELRPEEVGWALGDQARRQHEQRVRQMQQQAREQRERQEARERQQLEEQRERERQLAQVRHEQRVAHMRQQARALREQRERQQLEEQRERERRLEGEQERQAQLEQARLREIRQQMRQLQEEARDVREKRDLLYQIRKVGMSSVAVSAIALVAFPAGAAVHGVAIGCSILGSTSSAFAHRVAVCKEERIAVLERRQALLAQQ